MSSLPKKRGRKPLKHKQDIVNEVIISTNVEGKTDEQSHSVSNNDPHLILHLHMQHNSNSTTNCLFPKDSFEKSFFQYDPFMNEPVAYEDNLIKSTPEECNFNEKKKETSSIKNIFNQPSNNANSKDIHVKDASKLNNTLLKELIHESSWSNSTEYWCQWDCHEFDNNPVGLPVKFKSNKFLVVGCFCSLECATAYNFYDNEKNYDIWENYNLINMLSTTVGYKLQVNPALSRKCLNVFGGPLDIKAFRKKSTADKQLHLLQYPMVSLVEHIEEINETIPYHKNISYIPLDKVRVDKIEEANKDRVQGKKKSSLEEKMSLKFTN